MPVAISFTRPRPQRTPQRRPPARLSYHRGGRHSNPPVSTALVASRSSFLDKQRYYIEPAHNRATATRQVSLHNVLSGTLPISALCRRTKRRGSDGQHLVKLSRLPFAQTGGRVRYKSDLLPLRLPAREQVRPLARFGSGTLHCGKSRSV